jgi:Protein of unknown function (DUF3866)
VPSFRSGRVEEILEERRGLQRVVVDGEQAFVLTELIGPVAVGDDVVVNTTAVDLGLGTGGWHVVHWNLRRRSWDQPGGGHLMKLRYTSLQVDAGGAEEDLDDLPGDLGGAPVVVCTLHSQVAVVAAVLHHLRPAAHIAYVMTDGAALPIALSDLVHRLRADGVLQCTITAGHAFGGDLEAVSVPSALAVARSVAGADVIVVGMGPGVVGSGTGLGTTAVEAAAAVDTVAALGGTPILCARWSDADRRERHQGRSHHTDTVLRLIRTPGVPAPGPGEHPDAPDAGAVLAALGLRVTTMGRGPDEDPAFFSACSAAAALAARPL